VFAANNLSRQATYAGWDFSSTWGIIEGISYPYLTAFHPYGPPRVFTGSVPAGNVNQAV
jgi:hypothetical protein